MKTSCVIAVACIGSAAAFAPQTGARAATALNEKKEKTPLFNRIFGMDLYAPQADQNDYGARNKKNVSIMLALK